MTAFGKNGPKPPDETKTNQKTDWGSLSIAALLTFFSALQLSVFFSALWPYLLQLDSSISETFFGWIMAMYSLGQGITCPIFGYLVNKMGQSRSPTMIGLVMMIIGNFTYLMCPLTPYSKWVMLASRTINGMGAGVITIFRNFAVLASTEEDRSRSISLNMGAFALGLAIGPAFQVLFTPFGYPGIKLFGQFTLDMYTAPAYCTLFCNILSVILVLGFFKEATVLSQGSAPKTEGTSTPTALPPYDKIAYSICILTQLVFMFVITNVETIDAPFSMTMFNWNKEETVLYISLKHAVFGIISITIYSLDIVFDLGNRSSHRAGATLGLIMLMMFHVVTYAWPAWPGKITYQQEFITINGINVTNPNPVGCRPSFEWCSEVPAIDSYIYTISYVILCGIGFPLINVCMNTIFSKVIGPRNQGTLVGILLLVGCLARVAGPLFVSSLFEFRGPRPIWISEIIFTGGCALLWIVFFNRLVPLKITKSYTAGETIRETVSK